MTTNEKHKELIDELFDVREIERLRSELEIVRGTAEHYRNLWLARGDLLRDADAALKDLGACDTPDCSEPACLKVRHRIRLDLAALDPAAARGVAAKAVAWARPVYARPVNAPEPAEEWDELVGIEFYNRAEKPEGEGWRPLVFAEMDNPPAKNGST